MLRLAAFIWTVATVLHSAQADETAALYRAYWAGLPAGEIRLTLRDDPAAYQGEILIRTEGLPRLLTRFRASAVSEGRLAAELLPAPIRYDAAYDLRKRRDRRLSMHFAPRAGGPQPTDLSGGGLQPTGLSPGGLQPTGLSRGANRRYVALYHLVSPDVQAIPAWKSAADSEWTRRLRPHFRDHLRLVCRRYVRGG
jgi:hypothetical protein